jgi:hypothetical protein
MLSGRAVRDATRHRRTAALFYTSAKKFFARIAKTIDP